jgi:hypothetical protein
MDAGGGFVKLKRLRVGTRVRVHTYYRMPNLKTPVGVVEKSFSPVNHGAFEVRFEDGHSGLFWHHELTEVGEVANGDYRS